VPVLVINVLKPPDLYGRQERKWAIYVAIRGKQQKDLPALDKYPS
jgi:hypothetical protein